MGYEYSKPSYETGRPHRYRSLIHAVRGPAHVFADFDAPPPGDVATITVRNGSTVVWSGEVTLNPDISATVPITPTLGGDSHPVPANSVLALLSAADAAQAEFDISDLQYNSSYSSFYLNCITVPASLCANWQYAVTPSGGSLTNPGVGMDVTALSSGDIAYVYSVHRAALRPMRQR